MADPIARRLGIGSRLIRPAMIAGMLAPWSRQVTHPPWCRWPAGWRGRGPEGIYLHARLFSSVAAVTASAGFARCTRTRCAAHSVGFCWSRRS